MRVETIFVGLPGRRFLSPRMSPSRHPFFLAPTNSKCLLRRLSWESAGLLSGRSYLDLVGSTQKNPHNFSKRVVDVDPSAVANLRTTVTSWVGWEQ